MRQSRRDAGPVRDGTAGGARSQGGGIVNPRAVRGAHGGRTTVFVNRLRCFGRRQKTDRGRT